MTNHQKTWRSRKIKYYQPVGKKSPRFVVSRVKRTDYIRPPKNSIHFWRKFIITILLFGIAGILSLAALFFYYSRDLPSLAQIKSGTIIIPESTKIYDRTGQHLLYTIHGEENRTRIPLEQIPDYVKKATIATEDQDFYTRDLAIDFKGVIRAIIAVLKNRSFRESPGGSTITQQLVKNMILTREKTISRKIKEIILSFRIEQTLSRDEILELYLNQIPYGSNAYGIEQASQTFFGKSATQLTLAESALLAALPKATTYYSPFGSHLVELRQRHKVILNQMLEEGYITEEQWKEALEEDLNFSSGITNIQAPHFVIYVKEILAHRYGETELEQGGLKVITSLDYKMQKVAEKVVKSGAVANDKNGADNAALVAIDPKTGQILSLVGSRDYFDEDHDGNFNVATAGRQPGSSFKPVVYATLFTKGYTPNTILYDVKTDFDPRENQEYIPKDFDLKERGPVTIRKALAGSLNIPAVKALYLADIFKVLDYAAQLGYSTLDDPTRVGLSLALGGADVKLLEHVGAFAVFGNDGVRQPLETILRVENTQGDVLEEFKPKEGVRVFPANVARLVTDILADNGARSYIFGENSYLNLGETPAAVKTGTTNDSRDAWTVGYTPNLAAGVWVGNNDYSPMHKGMGGSRVAAPIWQAFMKEALIGKKIENFPKPDIPVTGKPILDGEIGGLIKVKIDNISGKLATAYTPEEYIEEVAFADFHSILHYIDPKNPLGPPPADPSLDPQYKNWEEAIQKWAKESELAMEFKTPPTEEDNIHTLETKPSLTIIEPQNNQIISEDSILVKVEVTAKRGISQVEYYIDEAFRESAGLVPYSRRLYFGSIIDGNHTITVKACDDVANCTSQNVIIQLNRGISFNPHQPKEKETLKPTATILAPQPGEYLPQNQFPIKVHLYLANIELAQRLNLYYNDQQGNPMIIGTTTSFTNENNELTKNLAMEWNNPPPAGIYPLYAILIDKDGKSYRTEINIIIK